MRGSQHLRTAVPFTYDMLVNALAHRVALLRSCWQQYLQNQYRSCHCEALEQKRFTFTWWASDRHGEFVLQGAWGLGPQEQRIKRHHFTVTATVESYWADLGQRDGQALPQPI